MQKRSSSDALINLLETKSGDSSQAIIQTKAASDIIDADELFSEEDLRFFYSSRNDIEERDLADALSVSDISSSGRKKSKIESSSIISFSAEDKIYDEIELEAAYISAIASRSLEKIQGYTKLKIY